MNRSKQILQMVLGSNSEKIVEQNYSRTINPNVTYQEDIHGTSSSTNLPTESVEDKVNRYLNTFTPVHDVYEYVEDDNEQKTYTVLQPSNFKIQDFQQPSGSGKEDIYNDDPHKPIRILSHHIIPPNTANYGNMLSESSVSGKETKNNHNDNLGKSIRILSHHVITPNIANNGNIISEVVAENEGDDNGNISIKESSDSGSLYRRSDISESSESITSESISRGNRQQIETRPEITNTNVEESEVLAINNEVDVSRREHKIWDRRNLCPFCFNEHTHFSRHIQRKHSDEPRVRKILSLPVGSTERKELWDVLRKEGNFALFKENKRVIAVRRPTVNESKSNANTFEDFAVCSTCSGVYKKKTLSRHATRCSGRTIEDQKQGRLYALSQSQTFLASARCQSDFLLKSRLRKEVFDIMLGDKISEVAKNDILICLFGETHLKKHKRAQIATVTSNKMRELARLLIALRDIIGLKNEENRFCELKHLIDVMKPEFFDHLVAATKVIAGYNPETKSFIASSLALHMGTSLKKLCNIIHRQILKKSQIFTFKDPNVELKNIKHLQKLIEDHWANELASLALKDMAEKHWEKPQIIPVTNDIIKFNRYVRNEVDSSSELLESMMENKNENSRQTIFHYKRLAKSIMALILVLNRKRIGEIQFLKTATYLKDFSDPNNQEELLESLTASEKILCKNFKRVVSGGKGSRPVPILFSPYQQKKIELLLKVRNMIKEIPVSNEYLFANPDSSKGWFHGVSVIRSFATACGAQNSASLTSTKFRKQTATILQVMNINENDMEQLATFMGHTKKTHAEWYRLPQDVYQTAKMAKLMTMIDQGKAHLYKGKGLEDIRVDETEVLDIEESNVVAVSRKDLNLEDSEVHDEETQSDVRSNTTSSMKSGQPTDNSKRQRNANSNSNKHTIEDSTSSGRDKRKSNAPSQRKFWTNEEKSIMMKYFKTSINNKTVPRKHQVEEFKLKHEVFKNVDWVRIKVYVYNTYKNQM